MQNLRHSRLFYAAGLLLPALFFSSLPSRSPAADDPVRIGPAQLAARTSAIQRLLKQKVYFTAVSPSGRVLYMPNPPYMDTVENVVSDPSWFATMRLRSITAPDTADPALLESFPFSESDELTSIDLGGPLSVALMDRLLAAKDLSRVAFRGEIENGCLARLPRFPKLSSVILATSTFDPEDVNHLFECSSLEELNLAHVDLSKVDFRLISRLESLKTLQLGGSQVTAEMLNHISSCRRLEVLDLCESPLRDADVGVLRQLPLLRNLDLRDTLIGDSSLNVLDDLKHLQRLNLRGTSITEEFFLHARSWPELSELDLCVTKVARIPAIEPGSMPSLRFIQLQELRLDRDSYDNLFTAAPSVRTVHISKHLIDRVDAIYLLDRWPNRGITFIVQ